MGDYAQQPYHLPLDWNMQLHSLINDASLRTYRKTLSRVSKPSSAGNSPHSQPRRRTMTTYNNNGFTQVLPVRNLFHTNTTTQRPSRPTSWHPSVKQPLQPQQPYYVPNCHPSWLRGDVSVPTVPAQQQSGMTSMYGLSTPITCPMSGDLLSTNDYFDYPNGESYNFLAPGPQVYTPVEPPDMLYSEPSELSTYSMEATPFSTATYPWMQHNNGFVSTDPAMIDSGHESVASADDLTAPPTPEMAYNHQQPTLISATQDDLDDGGDDLVAVGLYDEPSTLSFSSLLGGGDPNACHPTGKGLKLEETFTPADDDEEEDGDAENDD